MKDPRPSANPRSIELSESFNRREKSTTERPMNLITSPQIYLVGRQTVNETELARFLDYGGFPEWTTDAPNAAQTLVEIAGRLCYVSYKNPRPGGNHAYLDNILASGHGSVTEHAVWNFIITGVSRSLTHELIRHRVGLSPSELSQRFVDCSEVAFVVPPAMMPWHDAWKQRLNAKIEDACTKPDPRVDLFLKWLHGRRVNLLEYEKLTEALSLEAPQDLSKTDRRKWARQAARSALPNCAETKIFITANARALRHFIELRGSRHADDEIRRLAHAMLGVMQAETPGLFGDYSVNNGEVETQWRKV